LRFGETKGASGAQPANLVRQDRFLANSVGDVQFAGASDRISCQAFASCQISVERLDRMSHPHAVPSLILHQAETNP
jgi:hypothetical protein